MVMKCTSVWQEMCSKFASHNKARESGFSGCVKTHKQICPALAGHPPLPLPMESLVLQQHAPGDSTSISTCSLDLWFLIVSHSGSSGLTPLVWEVLPTRKSYFRLAKHRINISKTLLRFMLTHVVLRWICFLVC